ncbi:afadin [Pholidichthys leucotaenia]
MPEEEERAKLAKVIRQWNSHRLDLFEISQPDENLAFHGVMRFYFEDHIEGNMATKCLRVSSNSLTRDVIQTLLEKFRPDMKMLTTNYSLYEIHPNKEHKLDLDEKPLLVQLNWNMDNREGRFVLKVDKERLEDTPHEKEKGGVIQTFKRTLSKKGKKKEKIRDGADECLEDENRLAENSLNNSSICLSNLETQKICMEEEKQQRKAAADLPGLPIGIKLSDNAEDSFLSAVINYTNSSTVHFRLSPAYILYAVGRFALRRHRSRGSPPSGRTHSVTLITNKMVEMAGKVIQRQQTIAGALAFWMANMSELLNFLKHDKDLSPLTQQSQLDLSHLVHKAYSWLLQCLQNELRKHLSTFLIDPEQHCPPPTGTEMVLNTLMNTMALLRRCQVNPAFTIQLFSQLFHFVSAWLFNQLMHPELTTPGLHSHYWGTALRQRLTAIEAWAERQGLELAADCHLGHIIQATTLLTMNKYSVQDTKDIQRTCFKLNSLQLQMLLAGYMYAPNEPQIPPDLIDAVVTAAKVSADDLIRSEGRDIQLEEGLDLHLPFLLPEGGYSCDTVRGIPQGFREFLEPICHRGLCTITSQPNSKGDWTVYFIESAPSDESTYLAAPRQPEIMAITLNKPLNSGMGISIVAAKGVGAGNLGIYIKSIVPGGPAEMNGRLTVGDQLLSVDGHSLVGVNQERAAAIMMQTGPIVNLHVAKFAARYHGLGTLLNDSAPERATGDRESTEPNSNVYVLYGVVGPAPSQQLYGGSKRKKEQTMQRNRQLYRSNPNMTAELCLEDGDEPADPAVRGNIASVSTLNLCTDTFPRQYMTLPTPRSQDKSLSDSTQQQTFKVSLRPSDGLCSSKRSLMRQARSQEYLCEESGGPLLDKNHNMWPQKDQGGQQPSIHYSSFPIQSCSSTHNILSDSSPSKRQQQGSHTSCAGVWRTPFTQHSTPTPSIQPMRIDIPITRVVCTPSNPSLTTFRQSSSPLPVSMCQTVQVGKQIQSPQKQTNHISAFPISPTKKLPQPLLLSPQQRSSSHRQQTAKPQVSITPTKHVSFREPPPQQKKSAAPVKQKDPRQLSDPWRREAQEKLEKQQRLRAVELLEREVQDLQVKARHSAEENERLRKLNLEWQFQKRLQEIQERGEDEEEDEDLEMMVMIQQLEKRTQVNRHVEASHTFLDAFFLCSVVAQTPA